MAKPRKPYLGELLGFFPKLKIFLKNLPLSVFHPEDAHCSLLNKNKEKFKVHKNTSNLMFLRTLYKSFLDSMQIEEDKVVWINIWILRILPKYVFLIYRKDWDIALFAVQKISQVFQFGTTWFSSCLIPFYAFST